MPNASISGLASGLDTATIINQLMQIEAISQTRLQGRVNDEEREANSLRTVNAKLASLATKAEELTEERAFSPLQATASHEYVTTTADSGTLTGSFAFTVDRVATAHRVGYANLAATMDTVVATPGTQITIDSLDGSTPVQVDTGDGTLKSVMAAINGADAGVQAVAVRTDNGYLLRVEATSTGAASDFTISGIDQLGAATTVAGVDARISFDGGTLSSPTNTFTDVMSGLDITVSAEAVGESVDVTVARDTEAMVESVQALVDVLNSVLTEIGSLTAYGVDGAPGGILAGNSTLRSVRDSLLSAVSAGVGGKTLASAGIELDRDGAVEFDAEKFEAAYTADPAGTAALFRGTDGLAGKLHTIADDASDSTTGTVTLAIKGRNSLIDRMEDDIADWDVRLQLRRQSLERQYAALEVALQGLQSQSQWLAGQIAGLPSYDSGS